jgi:hypothetical protein
MELPAWLIDILRQFPMVVVIGFAIWYAEKRVREKEIRLEGRYDKNAKEAAEREDKLRKEVRADRDAETKRLQEAQKALTEANTKLLAAKDEQIATLTSELEKLRKELAASSKKLQG